MINQSGDLVCFCLPLCLLLFVAGAYKGRNALSGRSLFLSLPSHHYFQRSTIMSSPAYTSFPFSYKEDACAQDVVESMEQVGDLASLCLK